MTLEGSECKCGFLTISSKSVCPRCGREMKPHLFFDEGKVLSYVSVKVNPEDSDKKMDLVMVEIDSGPKLVCWTDVPLTIDQRIKVVKEGSLLRCIPP